MSNFDLHARNFFLTYSQAGDVTKQEILDKILSVCRFVSWALIGQETHEDGGRHFHAVFSTDRKWRVRQATLFDVRGKHPNIVSPRDVPATIRYCSKEDQEPLTYGTIPTSKKQWKDVRSATSKDEAIELIREIAPRDWYNNRERIEYALNQDFKVQIPQFTPRYTEFNICAAMQGWVDQRLIGDRPKSLILYGDTRCGKTQWARSLGRHMYFNSMFNLSDWDPDAEYAIFDDWDDWSVFFQYKCFLGAQEQFTLTDKYAKKRTVMWGKPCIVLSNDRPKFKDERWIQGNCVIVNVQAPLF